MFRYGRLFRSSAVVVGNSVRNKTIDSKVLSYFDLFPENFPKHGPPGDSFIINPKKLRREYRQLQSQHHPDVLMEHGFASGDKEKFSDESASALINKAFNALSNPYLRVTHFIQLNHPNHLDITQDSVSKSLILKFQKESTDVSKAYKNMLMLVLEAHELLEFADSEADLEDLEEENDYRIEESEQNINDLMHQDPMNWDKLLMEAIKLKYWMNIRNGIHEWEPGKTIQITH